jgi:hypothetical protein
MKASIEDNEAMRRMVNSPAPVRAGGAAVRAVAPPGGAERGALAIWVMHRLSRDPQPGT